MVYNFFQLEVMFLLDFDEKEKKIKLSTKKCSELITLSTFKPFLKKC